MQNLSPSSICFEKVSAHAFQSVCSSRSIPLCMCPHYEISCFPSYMGMRVCVGVKYGESAFGVKTGFWPDGELRRSAAVDLSPTLVRVTRLMRQRSPIHADLIASRLWPQPEAGN